MTERAQQAQAGAAGEESQEGAPLATLLFVDDEKNILTSLRRIFRPLGYKIFLATSGTEGLELLGRHEIDLVVSDMRMPEMDGATFLAAAAEKWPDTVRILLTGYADMSSTVAAINQGKIYQYISKPWEENEITLCVRHALEQRFLKQERDRLLQLTRKQNAELQDLNANLEEKVKVRTEELSQAMGMLESAHKTLKKSYVASIKVFSTIIEMREGTVAGHSRRVAELARSLAKRVGMNDDQVQQVIFAALLHDIGKIALPDSLMDKPFNDLSTADRNQVMKHPVIGEGVLMALDHLQEAARYIRGHHERYDGQGYPDKLRGDDIPLGARILALANDYDALQIGSVSSQRLSVGEVHQYIAKNKGSRYDPRLAELLLDEVGPVKHQPSHPVGSKCLTSSGLQEGMVLTKDLMVKDKVLLLAKGHVLDESLIQRIQRLERATGEQLDVHIAV